MILDQVYKTERDRLVESYVYKDPLFEQWKRTGRIIAERKMTEPEILDLFGKIESGMTNKDTGANRTWAGRGKDVVGKAYTNTKDAFNNVMSSIQNSAPVQAVDVAYDQATDAVAKLGGGENSKVMQAIKGYRNLVKEYPKASGFAKAALVAIAGLATGGAGLPAIAGLTYALDSAIRGDKLSSVIGKGAGAAAVTWAGQQVAGALKSSPAADSTVSASDSLSPGEEIAGQGAAGATTAPSRFDDIVNNAIDYKVKQGDTLSDILADRKINPEAFKRLPGNEVFFSPDGNPNILKAGQTIKLPDPADVPDLNRMSYSTPDPANYARFDKEYDTTGYSGQYNPNNSPYSLDATTNLKQQGLGRLGADSGIAADRVAADAGQTGMSSSALGGRTERYIPQPDGSWIDASTGKIADPAKLKASQDAVRQAFRESINFKRLPADKLFDDKLTVMTWALNESVGKPAGHSVHLTALGAYTVFENINRYARAVVKEADVGPGRPDLPDEFRPDMPGGSGGYNKSKKGAVGRGLDWINRAAGKVGGALSKFGHQFTTKVTKEKLKMDWHQAGKPSDSDALAAFLTKQGVPQEVVTDVYSSMGIPATATQPAAGKTDLSVPYYGNNPATGKPWTRNDLAAHANKLRGAQQLIQAPEEVPATNTTGSAPAAKLPQATSATAGMPSKVTYGKGFEKKPATTTQFPAFGTAGGGGYATSPAATSVPTAPTLPKPTTAKVTPATPAAPAAPKAPAAPAAPGTVGTYDTKTGAAKLGGKTMVALKDLPPAAQKRVAAVAEQANRMLENVKTKQDAEAVRLFIDQQFSKHGLLESALPQRKQLMDHVNKVSAIRRRLHARDLLA